MTKILWIESKRANSPEFVPGLRKKGYQIETVPTGALALSRMERISPDLVVINAASMRSNGSRICKSIRNQGDKLPILLIANQNEDYSSEVCADIILNLPFTIRKLNNRIARVLPGNSEQIIRVGSIRLDPERRIVNSYGEEKRLTPKLVLLLKIFMHNPGAVIKREKLFRNIWETNYVGDTRTLDVHISWLRQAIEKDPRNPKLLVTIRGVGYRLDV